MGQMACSSPRRGFGDRLFVGISHIQDDSSPIALPWVLLFVTRMDLLTWASADDQSLLLSQQEVPGSTPGWIGCVSFCPLSLLPGASCRVPGNGQILLWDPLDKLALIICLAGQGSWLDRIFRSAKI
jgi:hypothetical protein